MGAVKERYLYGDTSELRKEFYIPLDENPAYQKDVEYIALFRDNVRYIINLMSEIEHGKSDKKSGQKDLNIRIAYLAYYMEQFIKESNKDNFVTRLIFLEKLGTDMGKIFDEVTYEYAPFLVGDQKEQFTRFRCFIQYVGYCSIMKDGLLDKIEDEVAKPYAEELIQKQKLDFMSDVDEKFVKESDIYSALGKCLRLIDETDARLENFSIQHCKDCDLDDCYNSHCQEVYVRNSIDSQLDSYKKIKQFLLNRLEGKTYNYYEIKKCCGKILDDKLRNTIEELLTKNKYELARPQEFEPVKINKTDIRLQKNKIIDKLKSTAEVAFIDQDAIAAKILLQKNLDYDDSFMAKLDKDVRGSYDWIVRYTDKESYGYLNLEPILQGYQEFKEQEINKNAVQQGE